MIHLHGWSHYSMLRAIWDPKKIIETAKNNKQKAIAITDFNSAYGLLEFYEIAKDIKPILWTDINFSYDGKTFMNIVLLSKNYDWYKNLIKLISIAQTQNIERIPYLKMDDLKENSNWLIWISWWSWEIEKLISSWEDEALILNKIQEYEEVFSWEFYLEFLTYDYNIFPDRKKIEDMFQKFITENWKKAIVSSNYKYLEKKQKQAYDVLICIKNNRRYLTKQRPSVKWEFYIMDEKDIRNILTNNKINEKLQTKLIEQTHFISDSIDCQIPLHQLLFPKYEVKQKYDNLYKKLK